MSKKRIILISGVARSGKDTLAKALSKEMDALDPRVVKFATPLKTALQAALNYVGLGHINVFTEDTAEKELLRPLMVEFGRYCRSKDKEVFVKATLRDIDGLFANGVGAALISDCRYLNEARKVRDYGIEQDVHVHRVHIEREARGPANEEEQTSLAELERDPCLSRHFRDGDLSSIENWAKELCGNQPKPDWLKGGPVDPAKVAAYCHPKPYWTNPEAIWTDMNGDTHGLKDIKTKQSSDSPLVTVTASVTNLMREDEAKRIKEAADRLIREHVPGVRIDELAKRLDDLEIKVYAHNTVGEAVSRAQTNDVIGLKLTLERIDARLKRLEVARG